MISGDKNLLVPGTSAYERLDLQRSQVNQLDVFGYKGFWSGPRGGFEVMYATLRTRYDVITVQEPFWRGLLAWFAARTSGAKLNIQLHADLAGQTLIKRLLANFLLRRADSIRVVSQKAQEQAEALAARASIRVLPIYIDLAPFRNLAHHAHPRFAKTILWIGRFEEEKDPLAAIEVMRQVCRAGIDAGLVMLGAGSLEGALRSAAEGLPAMPDGRSRVEFPGWQEPGGYLAMADVVLSTSPYESYGASIVEALAAGVPVVALDVGVAREAGAIIAPRQGLAEAVTGILRSGARGELKLPLLSREEWAAAWRETL